MAPARLGLFTTPPHNSLANLEGLRGEIEAAESSFPAELLISENFDVRSNIVEVRTSNVAEATQLLASRFGSNAPISVAYEAAESTQELTQYFKASGEVAAGDAIEFPQANHECSAGFGAFLPLSNGYKIPFLLTASHCAPLGDEVIREDPQGHKDNLGLTLTSGRSAESRPFATDVESIAVHSPLDAPQKINGTYSYGPVKRYAPMPTKAAAVELCHAGAGIYQSTGYGAACGPITLDQQPYLNRQAERHEIRTCFRAEARPGDSGGPVWILGSDTGVGIVTQGRDEIEHRRFAESCAVELLPRSDTPPDATVTTSPAFQLLQLRTYEP